MCFGLLNARKRRCRVHALEPVKLGLVGLCSTLESVVVGFTPPSIRTREAKRTAQRSKASLSGSLARRTGMTPAAPHCSTLESVVVGFTTEYPSKWPEKLSAQRSKASLSGSLLSRIWDSCMSICSTLESVVVGFTIAGSIPTASGRSAQRSKASLSGSPRRHPARRPRTGLLNARKRRCRVHVAKMTGGALGGICSTLESVVVGFTPAASLTLRLADGCSTLESVVVGFTADRVRPFPAQIAAQRSKASLSGSRRLSA